MEDAIKKLTQELEELKKQQSALTDEVNRLRDDALRADDYRQIVNAMAGHSYGYYGQIQDYELANFWSQQRDDIAYAHGELCYFGRDGVKNYYSGTTKRLHKAQRAVVEKVYGKTVPEGFVPGYRIMNMLTTPYVEIAADRKTAQGIWMSISIKSRVDADGNACPEVTAGRYSGDFVNEDGKWKIWHRVDYTDFDMDIAFKFPKEGGPDMSPEEFAKFLEAFPVFPPTPEIQASMNVKTNDIGGAEMYSPTAVSRSVPKIPTPYDSWSEDRSYVKIIADGYEDERMK
jgi:hypothetical protein